MPMIEAPELARHVILAGSGDVIMSVGKNSETFVFDTLLLTLTRPGAAGPMFKSEESLEQFLLTVAELYGKMRDEAET